MTGLHPTYMSFWCLILVVILRQFYVTSAGAVAARLAAGIQEEAFQVMHPGPGAVWQPLKGGAAAAAAGEDGSRSAAAAAAVKLEVPLVQGCALVRLKPTQ